LQTPPFPNQNPKLTTFSLFSHGFKRSHRGAIQSKQDKNEAAVGAGSHRFGGGRRVAPARGSRRREGKFRQGDPLQREDRFV